MIESSCAAVQCPLAGHEQGDEHVEVYREVMGSPSEGHLYSAVLPEVVTSAPHAMMLMSSRSPLNGLPILSNYPPLALLQRKRLAARRHAVTYAYDFPAVFENALRETWAARAAAGACLPLWRLKVHKRHVCVCVSHRVPFCGSGSCCCGHCFHGVVYMHFAPEPDIYSEVCAHSPCPRCMWSGIEISTC